MNELPRSGYKALWRPLRPSSLSWTLSSSLWTAVLAVAACALLALAAPVGAAVRTPAPVAPSGGATVRIKEVAAVQGVRNNALVGYGLDVPREVVPVNKDKPPSAVHRR